MLKNSEYLEFEVEYFYRNSSFVVLDCLENDLATKNIKLFEKTFAMLANIKQHFHQRHVSDKVEYIKRGDFCCWELRTRHKNDIYRILFKEDELNRKFIVFHGFIKKDQKTPPSEINRALNYWEEYRILNKP